MKKYLMILVIFFTLIYIISSFHNKNTVKKPVPTNLLIISVDTLRADHMGVYGYKKNTTPNIDKWAKDALVFNNVTTSVPMTYPSLLSLMTGKSPSTVKILSNVVGELANKLYTTFDRNTPTLANILKRNDYASAAYVVNKALSSKASDLDTGFDGYYTNDYKKYMGINMYSGLEQYNLDYRAYEKFIDEAGIWLDDHKNSKFFLWIHLIGPHDPYFPPDDNYKCKYNDKYCSQIKSTDFDELNLKRIKIYDYCQPLQQKSLDDLGIFQTLYDGDIGYTDSLVQRILNKLKDAGLNGKTTVVLYGDHGEGFDHDYYLSHSRVLYRSSIRIPLIIKSPNINTNKRSTDIAMDNADILPTILGILNIPVANIQFDGKDMSKILEGSSNINEQRYFYSVNRSATKFAISDERYHFIYSTDGSKCNFNSQKEELYNYIDDPDETDNLAEKQTDTKDKMKNLLLKYISENNNFSNALYYLEKDKDSNSEDINRLKSGGY